MFPSVGSRRNSVGRHSHTRYSRPGSANINDHYSGTTGSRPVSLAIFSRPTSMAVGPSPFSSTVVPSTSVRVVDRAGRGATYDIQDIVEIERSKVVGYTNSFRPTPTKDAESYPELYNRLRQKGGPSASPSDPSCPAVPESLPAYSCSVLFEGYVSMKRERSSPFSHDPEGRAWTQYYAVLRGTVLHLFHPTHRAPFRLVGLSAAPPAAVPDLEVSDVSGLPSVATGPLFASFSLQHAEVGAALDFRPIPPRLKSIKTRVASLLNLRTQTDAWVDRNLNPDLYEPSLTYAFRLRAHQWQMLFAVGVETDMLDWIDRLCQAIDISLPIDGRSEVRQRVSPRRGQRMMMLQGPNSTNPADDPFTRSIGALEAMLDATPNQQPTVASSGSTRLSMLRDMYDRMQREELELVPTVADDEAYNLGDVPVKPVYQGMPRQTSQQDLRYRKRIVPLLFREAALINRSMLDNNGRRVYVVEKRAAMIPWEQYWATKTRQQDSQDGLPTYDAVCVVFKTGSETNLVVTTTTVAAEASSSSLDVDEHSSDAADDGPTETDDDEDGHHDGNTLNRAGRSNESLATTATRSTSGRSLAGKAVVLTADPADSSLAGWLPRIFSSRKETVMAEDLSAFSVAADSELVREGSVLEQRPKSTMRAMGVF